ncbi:hypothetical protein BDF20DRAFT_377059 [Mycotypha africana]|uniref:uncharacterized protein n=1 Tax=Mycotypha africana TaxID=64632 RepID=UPI002301637A|nr:uncharacterized protein BDF20DRAFT_377059 [Mycotypha africana]KAI8984291.1 hypothetical protein BDF20DRAFT_377059 [Mycotypha africana]
MRSEVDSPAFTPVMGEREIPAHPPPTSNPPNLIERTPSETSQDKFPPVIPEEPISDDEVKESGVDDFVNAQEEDEFFDVHDDTTTTAAAAAAAAAVPPMTVADTLMARMSPIKVEFDVNNSSSLDSLAENGIPASPLVALENKEKGMSLSGAKELEEPEKLQERESVDPASISSDVRDLESKDKSIEDLIPEVKDNKVPSESPLETSLAEKDEKKPLLTADNDDDNAVVRDKPKDSDHLSDSHSVKPIIETPGLTEAMAERSLGAHHESGALDEAASEKPSDTPLVQEMPDKKHTDNVSVTEPLEKEEDLEGKKPFDEEEKSMAPKVTEPEGKADGAPDIVDSASLDNEKTPLKEEAEEKPTTKPFDSIPTSGPRLTSPSRVRPASARRSPLLTKESQEPSQMELLKKELDADASQEKEEEKKQSVPEEEETSSAAVEQPAAKPAKPIKPIFAKFPTPFAVSGSQEELIKRNLRPTSGGRRLWEPTAQNTNSNNSSSSPEEPDHDHKENESPSPRPMGGVKSIASRFNFNNNNGGSSNEVLETKLKNYTKHEVEKLRKELLEERDKRMQLEEKVEALSARLNALLEQ